MGFKIVEDRPTPPAVYNRRIYTSATIIAFGAITFGYDSAFIGVTITQPAFTRDFGLANLSAAKLNDVSSNITSAFQAGAFFGCLFCFPILERLGRRACMQISTFVFIIGALLQTAATHQLSLIYVGRVLVGLGCGGITSSVPTFIAELSPPPIRGRLTGFFEIAYQIGAVIGFWINYGIKVHLNTSDAKAYRIPFAIQLVPAGMLAIGTLFLRETPHYLIKRGRVPRATENICYLRKLEPDHEYVQDEIKRIEEQIEHERSVAKGDENSFIGYLTGALHEIFLKGIRNRLGLIFMLFMFQNFSGVNSINYYSPTIFKSLGVSNVSLYTGIYGLIKAIGSIIFYIWFIDRWGRRPPAITSNILCSACMLYIAVYVKVGHPATEKVLSSSTAAGGKAAIAIIMMFAFFWSFGLNGLPWIIASEIYPVRIRGLCAAYSAACQWLWQFVVTKATPSMITTLGWGTFLFFSMVMLVATFYAWFFIPETKGRRLEDMDEIFGFVDRRGPKRDESSSPNKYDEERREVG